MIESHMQTMIIDQAIEVLTGPPVAYSEWLQAMGVLSKAHTTANDQGKIGYNSDKARKYRDILHNQPGYEVVDGWAGNHPDTQRWVKRVIDQNPNMRLLLEARVIPSQSFSI